MEYEKTQKLKQSLGDKAYIRSREAILTDLAEIPPTLDEKERSDLFRLLIEIGVDTRNNISKAAFELRKINENMEDDSRDFDKGI